MTRLPAKIFFEKYRLVVGIVNQKSNIFKKQQLETTFFFGKQQ